MPYKQSVAVEQWYKKDEREGEEQKNSSPERKENSVRSDKTWREKRSFCESTVQSILWKQENLYCQLVSLIIQLNLAVGDFPLETLATYPAVLYALMVLLAGLGALAKFASQPSSFGFERNNQGGPESHAGRETGQ